MGDVIHTMAAVAALRAALPGMKIGWAVEERWAELLRAKSCQSPRRSFLTMPKQKQPLVRSSARISETSPSSTLVQAGPRSNGRQSDMEKLPAALRVTACFR